MSDGSGRQPAEGPAAATTSVPAGTRPGAALRAAVLAFVQAGLLLALVLVVTVAALTGDGPGDDVGVAALVCITACSLAGLDLLGGLFLLRASGRTVLLVTAWAEAGLLGLLLLVALVDVTAGRSADPAVGVVGIVVLLTLLALAAGRLVLVTRPAVPAWLAARRQAAAPPAWSPQLGPVAPAAAPATPTGLLVGLLVPVAVLALVATVTLALTGGSVVIADGPGAGYRGTGEPSDPPAPGDDAYDSRYAGPAADCHDGDMTACDDLYFRTPVGDPYETYGSTCGGRLDDETSGGCVGVFGLTD